MADEKGRKNPFAVKPQTTVKRSKDEVYPERKGLNKPQYLGNSKLDLLFQRLESDLSEDLVTVSVESLYKKIFKTDDVPLNARYKLIEQLLEDLSLIQQSSMENYEKHKEKNLISISLHDIKTFGKLLNLIIILGIYPCLVPFKIGIPFEKRRLNDFGKPVYKPIKIVSLLPNKDGNTYTERFKDNQELLLLIYKKMGSILSIKSDVLDLLMKGSGYSDYLTIAITLATSPYFEQSIRQAALRDFENVTNLASTFELYQDYSLLLQSPSPVYFKLFVMEKLQNLPYSAAKGDGLLTLIEFVTGLRDQEEISVEKFDHVANVVLLKPKAVSSIDYFTSIGNQCYDLLININRPTICTCVIHVVEKLWEKNQRIVQDFILKRIWSNLLPDTLSDKEFVLVSEADLNNTTNVLLSISKRCQSVTLLKATFMPILVSLWSYYSFLKANEKGDVIQNIFMSYLTLLGEDQEAVFESLDIIARNLVTSGGDGWLFRFGPNSLLEICRQEKNAFAKQSAEEKVLEFMKLLDNGCGFFIVLLKQLENEPILMLFEALLKRWLKQDQQPLNESNSFIGLVDLRLLESIAKEFNDKLAQSPLRILKIVASILELKSEDQDPQVKHEDSDDEDSDNEEEGSGASDEIRNVVLELLSAILSETNPPDLGEDCRVELSRIHDLLLKKFSSLSSAQALLNRIKIILKGEIPPKNQTDADRKMLDRAMSNLQDPLVPIRAHGLYIFRQLIEQRSSVLSIKFVVNMLLLQLKDPEPFVYLNVIKTLECLLEWDTEKSLPFLVSLYAGYNEKEKLVLDERLKVGEALLRFVQTQDEAFAGDSAKLISNGALSMIRLSNTEKVDDKLRMSAMSLLGTCCNVNPIGILENLENALDCALGILQLETDKEQAIMRRSAIVLIHDLIIGTSESSTNIFPSSYREKVLTVLRYTQQTDSDLLTREQATSVLETIEELVAAALESNTE